MAEFVYHRVAVKVKPNRMLVALCCAAMQPCTCLSTAWCGGLVHVQELEDGFLSEGHALTWQVYVAVLKDVYRPPSNASRCAL